MTDQTKAPRDPRGDPLGDPRGGTNGAAAQARLTGRDQRAIASWCLYDWANSAFPTVILTFVFAIYFQNSVVGDEAEGSSLWAFMIGATGIAVALLSPVVGAVADHAGPRKPWLGALVGVCIVACAGLWFVEPMRSDIALALILAGIAAIAFEQSLVFYNAMLPDLVPHRLIGRVSGWGWGMGYFGGLGCLAAALILLIQPEQAPFGLDRDTFEHVRATALLVVVWFALFSAPIFLFTPDRPSERLPIRIAVKAGIGSLWQTVQVLREPGQGPVIRFLIASALYRDGLGTLFAVGGLYAAGTFDMDFNEILIFAIGMNVSSGIGAIAFAWMDDRAGPKPTIILSLIGLIAFGVPLLFIDSKFWFMGLAFGIGLFVGPVQSASRSLLARMAPDDRRAQYFGLYALTGKSIAFLGPLAFAVVTAATGSQRYGMATILIFLAAGLAIIWPLTAGFKARSTPLSEASLAEADRPV